MASTTLLIERTPVASRRRRSHSGDGPTVDVADASHDAIAGHGFFFHAELVAGVLRELAELHEGAGLEKLGETLTGGEQAFFVALGDLVLAAAHFGEVPGGFEFVEVLGCNGHRSGGAECDEREGESVRGGAEFSQHAVR